MKTHLSPRDLLLTLAVVTVWGYTLVPIKVARVVWSSLVPPLPLAALSFAFEGGAAVVVSVATMLVFGGLAINVYGVRIHAWLASRP